MKGDTRICSHHIGITPLNTTYKIFYNLLYNTLINIVETKLRDFQMGFRRDWSATDNIHTIKQIYEKSHEYDNAV
jgi:hypothetical protein